MSVVSIYNYKKTWSGYYKAILLESKTAQLEFLAHHDSLTGLYNRRSFGLTPISAYETHAHELKGKFSLVDKALYESKASGRNQLTVKR